MPPRLSWSFSECLVQLRRARSVWEAAGVKVAHTRIERYELALERLVKLWPDKRHNSLTEEEARDTLRFYVTVVARSI